MVPKKMICCLIMLILCSLASPVYASRMEVLTTPNVVDDRISTLGTVFMDITAGALKNGDAVIIGLPDGFEFCNSLNSSTTQYNWPLSVVGKTYRWGNDYNYIEVPEKYNTYANGLYFANSLSTTPMGKNEIKVEVHGTPTKESNCFLSIHLGAVYIDSGYRGDINLSFNTPSGSGFGFLTGGATEVANNVNNKSKDMEPTNDQTKGQEQEEIQSESQTIPQVQGKIITLLPGSVNADINGTLFKLDAAPYIDARCNRVMVPLRIISEALDAEVNWQPATKQVIIQSKENKKVILSMDSQNIFVNGAKIKAECAPEMVDNDKVFVPLRVISETLGASVDYTPATKQVSITKY